jgi:hypothetical protein
MKTVIKNEKVVQELPKSNISSTPNKTSLLFECWEKRYQRGNETPEQTVERITRILKS